MEIGNSNCAGCNNSLGSLTLDNLTAYFVDTVFCSQTSQAQVQLVVKFLGNL